MKEKILEILRELGFKLEELEGLGYGFSYEGLNYVYIPVDDDESFINITVPSVFDFNPNNVLKCYDVLNNINSTVKYAKAYKVNNSVWLFYEREVVNDEDLKQVIIHMIFRLDIAMDYVRKVRTELDDDVEVEEECDDTGKDEESGNENE